MTTMITCANIIEKLLYLNVVVIRDSTNKSKTYKVSWVLTEVEANVKIRVGKEMNATIKYIVLFHHRQKFIIHTSSCIKDIYHLHKILIDVQRTLNVISIVINKIIILIKMTIDLNSVIQDRRCTP